MDNDDEAYHRAREQACREAASKASSPAAAAIHNALADQHRALAGQSKRPTLHLSDANR